MGKRKFITPLDQCLSELQTEAQKHLLMQNLEPLNEQSREDLCLAIVAYIRFGIKRPFGNPLMHVIFTSYIEVIDRF